MESESPFSITCYHLSFFFSFSGTKCNILYATEFINIDFKNNSIDSKLKIQRKDALRNIADKYKYVNICSNIFTSVHKQIHTHIQGGHSRTTYF